MNCVICGKEIPEKRLKRHRDTCSKSCANKKRYLDPNERLKTSISSKKSRTPEVRQKISNTLKQDKYKELHQKLQKDLSQNKDAQAKKSKSLKEHWKSVNRQQHSQAIKAGQAKNNAYEKISKASIEHWQSEDYRNTVIQHIKDSWSNEKKLAHSIKLTEIYKDIELRQKVGASVKLVVNTPEIKEKHDINIKIAISNPEVKLRQRQSVKQAYVINKKSIIAKRIQTMKLNGSFHHSKDEQQCLEILQIIFGKEDIETEYNKDERYPYKCDFYIKSIDLFIELDAHWTHGGMPFDEKDEACQKQLQEWEDRAKTSNFYIGAINVWTKADVAKRQRAIDQNLNWLHFYSVDSFKSYFIENFNIGQ